MFVNKHFNYSQPHEYFTEEEQLIWKIITFFILKKWIMFPDPAK